MKTGQNVKINQIFRQFWIGIRPNRGVFFSTIFLNTITLVIGILIPLFYKEFFDVLGRDGDKTQIAQTLIKIIIFILLLKVVNWFLFRLGIYMFDFLASKVMARLKQNSFNYTLKHSYSFFANNFTGSLVQRVNRFTRAYETLSEILVYNILSLFITVTGSIIITWFIAPLVAIIIIIWVILVSIFNISFSTWKLKYDVSVAEADSKTTGYLSDTISNNNAVSLFTANIFEQDGFKSISDDQANKTRFSWYLGDTVDAVQAIFITMAEFFIFYFTLF